MWKKSSLFDSFSSKCVCTPEGGCDEDCQNRIMLYECNDNNCAAGRAHCTNRAFADLQERRKAGGKYRIGVEVIKTADRGYGVRSNRCFDAHQIIVEYTGEIITEDECDRRMNEDYKDNDVSFQICMLKRSLTDPFQKCYYLMSFDQQMIIDATKGSIARFVNHSCKPNCRMVKWIVGGKPRMALFAGDNPIMTGEELTYDYNFDPFSAKNVQECRCGSDNCRGVLGPKPKDLKPVKESIKEAVKAGVKAGKRKLKELLGGDEADNEDSRSPKKRKMKEAKGIKRSASSASMRLAKGAAKAVKKSVSAQLLNARQAVSSKRGGVITVKKTMKASSLKTYGKGKTKLSSRNSSLIIVEADKGPRSGKGNVSSLGKRSVKKNIVRSVHGSRRGARGASGGTIRVISVAGED
jgi:histone-lysine N-methyltransferase ASH1L